ncbi:MAG: DUF2809 domain-containing protein [Tepidisphaeraceae bacterium]
MTGHARSRARYAAILFLAIIAGLASRRLSSHLAAPVSDYAGDTLWAACAYLVLAISMPQTTAATVAALAIGFSFCIELSQLYHAPWIDSLRATTIGGLILGFGFVWSDLVCYTTGVLLMAGCDVAWFRRPLMRR